MSLTTITKVGAFTDDVAKQINDNFTSLSASTAGGTLTDAHILVGNGSNLATDVAVSGDVTLANTGAITVVSIGGAKIASGITALDGSNPTTVATGLTSVTGFSTCLHNTAGVNTGTAFITYGTISGGNVPIYGWVVAGTASTGTDDVAWTAIGT
jgi:hypothetical protein